VRRGAQVRRVRLCASGYRAELGGEKNRPEKEEEKVSCRRLRLSHPRFSPGTTINVDVYCSGFCAKSAYTIACIYIIYIIYINDISKWL